MKKSGEENKAAPGVEPREITAELQESYLNYAMSVIVSRALPDVRDGLKPVHRRILWAMWDMGLTHSAKLKKSANVVGEVLGRYHPHGDTAVYDSMVRMAQNFSLRYPLIEGQGNFGCFTKDTKVKLVDGRSLSFEKLVKEDSENKVNYTYTVNGLGLIAIAKIEKPRLTRKSAELVKVTLDNGAEIRCTPDHRFMLRDGAYKEAEYLTPDDSLMPIYEKLSEKTDRLNREGYILIHQNKTGEWVPAHHLADNYNLTHGFYKKSDGRVRHHLDFNKLNNNPDLVRQEINNNHRIIKVEKLPEKEDVYDLTVSGSHNFSLDAGVFVHNSVDGDSAAAMRYTECRLSKIAEELLADIEKETVDWQPNYDASREEPKVLPSKFPNLLVNGGMGIAVGMATSIPPHNLGEIVEATAKLLDHPKTSAAELMEVVKGPDFPTGGIIYDRKTINEAYAAGRGSITTRALAEVTEKKSGQYVIVITEIPYQVNKAELIIKIAELIQDKKIEGIRDVRDESDKDGLRIVIELKTDVSPQKILNQLYKNTDLQKDFHLNLIALQDRGVQPQLMSLKDMLEQFIDHRKEVVRRRAEFDLKKAKERAHILEGLAKALSVIDKIIATIKKSSDKEEAHKNLVKNFKLTDIQATAILEMRLQTLAALERQKIEDELKEKLKLIKDLDLLLRSPEKIKGVIKDELKEMKEKFGDERRTKVMAGGLKEFREEDLVPEEETVITLSAGGYIKRSNPGDFRVQRRGGKGIIGGDVGEEDFVKHFVSAVTHDNILFFTSSGKVFQTKVYEIPAASRTSKGKAIHNFLDIPTSEHVSAIIAYGNRETGFLTMVTENGVIKKVGLKDFENVRKSGIIAIKLRSGDKLKWVGLSEAGNDVLIATANGQAIRFKENDLRPMGRTASGVTAIRLKKGDKVSAMEIILGGSAKEAELLAVMANGYAKRTALKEYKVQRRGGSGIKTAKITAKTGPIVAARVITDEEELLALSSKGQIIKTLIKDVRVAGRATQGVRIMSLNAGDKVAGIVCL